MKVYEFGISGLDELLPNALVPGTLVVIGGSPGSGKTTLASTICLKNAIKGFKCLYISFQEDREKLFKNMLRLGLNLSEAASKGLLNFIKLPLLSTVDDVLNEISTLVSKEGYNIVVVDSINPLLKAVEGDLNKRAYLQNFFAELPKMIEGIVVLLYEMQEGMKTLSLGDIEFVADVVVSLRQMAERNLVSRWIKIKKARNVQLNVIQAPFTIIEGRGIEVWAPILIKEILPPAESLFKPEHVSMLKAVKECGELSDFIINSLVKGKVTYITYTPDFRPAEILTYASLPLFLLDAKVLVVSYKTSPTLFRYIVEKTLEQYDINVKELPGKNLMIKNINPSSLSLVLINAYEIEWVRTFKPDIVWFHGVDVPQSISKFDTYAYLLINQLNFLKKEQVLTIRDGSYINKKLHRFNSTLSDTVIKIKPLKRTSDYEISMWTRGFKPLIITGERFRTCVHEIIKSLLKARVSQLKT